MTAVCKKYGIKLLTYGSLVSSFNHNTTVDAVPGLGSIEVTDSEWFEVRRLHLAKVAWPADARTLFRDEATYSFTTKGR